MAGFFARAFFAAVASLAPCAPFAFAGAVAVSGVPLFAESIVLLLIGFVLDPVTVVTILHAGAEK